MKVTESQLRRIITKLIRESLKNPETLESLKSTLETNPNQPNIDKDKAIQRLMQFYMDQGISETEAWAIATAELQGQ